MFMRAAKSTHVLTQPPVRVSVLALGIPTAEAVEFLAAAPNGVDRPKLILSVHGARVGSVSGRRKPKYFLLYLYARL